ncbi:MAG: hypothetical protein ACOYO2_06165 [Mycobacterium sp.]
MGLARQHAVTIAARAAGLGTGDSNVAARIATVTVELAHHHVLAGDIWSVVQANRDFVGAVQ